MILQRMVASLCVLLAVLTLSVSQALGASQTITRVLVLTDKADGARLERYAQMFADHMGRRFPSVDVAWRHAEPANDEPAGQERLIVRAGVYRAESPWAESLDQPVTPDDPGPEGFVLRIDMRERTALVAGVDERGVLYGLGRLLHLTRHHSGGFTLDNAAIRTAPRYRMRAANGSEKASMDRKLAKLCGARELERGEGYRYFEELLLLGANQLTDGWGSTVFVNENMFDPETGAGVGVDRSQLADDYGINYMISHSINGLGGSPVMPDNWRASDHGVPHRSNICISVPEARSRLLELKTAFFRYAPRIDSIMHSASDVAGCECERCRPWAKTYYELCRDMSEALLRYKPDAEVYVTNQDFSSEENEWFFAKIHGENPAWLTGYASAPGGSENSTYGDILINPQWDRYPGITPNHTFLKSRLKYLHPNSKVIEFVDISHWKRAQYGLAVIDPAFSEVYPRRTFNVRPRAYEQIIKSIMPYVDGVHGYSEGFYDDFNKYLLLRLLWSPSLTAEEIALEYYTYHCGREAAPLLVEAAFHAEQIHEQPLADSAEDIELFYAKIKRADTLIPKAYRAGNWRYAMLAQRAAIDLYILRRYQQRRAVYDGVLRELADAADAPSRLADALEAARDQLAQLSDTTEMRELVEQARQWDDVSDVGMAIRSYALIKAQQVDSVGSAWLAAQVDTALLDRDTDRLASVVNSIVDYERLDEGAFYDNCGTIDEQPHFDFTSGELYYGTGRWPDDARPSRRSYNYSFESQEGLEFNYHGLNKTRDYQVTLTYPNPSGVSFALNSNNEFYVLADGQRIGHAVPSGKGFDTFSFHIPPELTEDGRLNLALRKVPGKARSTCVSEVWLRPIEGDR